MALAKYELKRAAAAPSITRWSHDSDSGRMKRHDEVVPSVDTCRQNDRHTPRIATSGALMIGVK